MNVVVTDYAPFLKGAFAALAEPWLTGIVNGKLEDEDRYTLHHPDEAYLAKGGFLFFALVDEKPVGCVALKRLDERNFEFCKLFVYPNLRKGGIATKLIEQCIMRSREKQAANIWLQTTDQAKDAHRLYYKLGFIDSTPPATMDVLARTTKIMSMSLI